MGKKDACYRKVRSRYSKWPSAYASGALVKCRKVGAANWGNSSPAKQTKPPGFTDKLQDKADAKARKAAIAVDEGRDRKATRLYKRAARLENRAIKIEERKAKRRKK